MEFTDDVISRGNKYKFVQVQHHCHYDLRKCIFTNRVIPIWNSLSVVFADTVIFQRPFEGLRLFSPCDVM